MTIHLRYEVHTPLPLLFLELQRNSSNRSSLDTLHQVGDEPSDLVPHTLGWDDSYLIADALVCVEVHSEPRVVLFDDGSGRLLHGLRTDTLRTNTRSCTINTDSFQTCFWIKEGLGFLLFSHIQLILSTQLKS